jgi:spore coat protein U-like protein
VISLVLAAVAAQAMEPSRADTPLASMDIAVTGTAVPVCVLGAVTAAAGTNAAFTTGTIAVDKFIDPSTALVKDSTMQLQITNAMCNYNTKISLSSKNGGMTSDNASTVTSGDFLTVVPYIFQANWNGLEVTLDTTQGKTVQKPTTGATIGTLTLNFTTTKSTTPVVKGDYKDTVTVTIGGTM